MKNSFLRKAAILIMVFTLFPLTFSDCTKTDPAVKPVISTSTVINIAATTATAGGFVSSDGGADVTSYGVCWSPNANPSISDSKTSDGTGTGQFVSSLTGLTAGTAYHVRAYAINSVGTSYGADVSFTTLGQSPTGLTQPASNISLTGATLNGIINPNNLSTTVTFEYGPSTTYGSTVTATQSPVTGNNLAIVSADISGLTQGTIYHFRVKTVNSIGTINGSDLIFTTLGQAPAAVTLPATNISTAAATLNGAVNPNSVSTTVTFEYGTTTSYGQTATATQSPVTGSSILNLSKDISSLSPWTTYHYRVKTVNSLGTIYGGDMLFMTSTSSTTVTDIDGNIYNTVTIGTQVWMKENLKVTKYRDGSSIPNVTDNTAWLALTTGAYCWYNNDAVTNKNSYGGLYNWYAVSDNRNICPIGWHIPTDAEWKIMEIYLGMSASEADVAGDRGTHNEGGKLKETGTLHWLSPNTGADNSSGFTGLGAGYRYGGVYGTFYQMNWYGCWWTYDGYDRIVFSDATYVERLGTNYKTYGFSVRCVKD